MAGLCGSRGQRQSSTNCIAVARLDSSSWLPIDFSFSSVDLILLLYSLFAVLNVSPRPSSYCHNVGFSSDADSAFLPKPHLTVETPLGARYFLVFRPVLLFLLSLSREYVSSPCFRCCRGPPFPVVNASPIKRFSSISLVESAEDDVFLSSCSMGIFRVLFFLWPAF